MDVTSVAVLGFASDGNRKPKMIENVLCLLKESVLQGTT